MTSSEQRDPLYGEWNIGGFRIRWMQWGTGKPDLIGIHGFAASTRTWHLIAPQIIDQGKSMLSIGLPYHNGEDPETQPDLNIVRFAEALTGLLRSLGIQEVPVVAHSFGCRILSAAAIHDPALFSRLILVAPGGFHPKEDILFRLFRRQPLRFLLQQDWLMQKGLLRIAPDINPEKLIMMGKVFHKLTMSYPYTSPRALGLLPILSVYTGRTTLIMGRDDGMLPFGYHKKIARFFKDVRTVEIPMGGHVPMLRQPEAFFQVLADELEWTTS
ncbi:MAG: alpha/beta hydrolase [Bacteroidetes bacterium]|nr:alpha/beta hydrolase [Bacteroidota bacterium]MCH8523322.1 alpha/beta hydrolase [Balneolales bacterium]